MFIKLTKLDGRPVWLNASFIVTVEPRREGFGSIVVPIGDGLDYDVRESTEDVLRLLDGAPEPKVVPVPVSDCLTKTPTDVSPAPEHVVRQEEVLEVKVEESAPQKRRSTKAKAAGAAKKARGSKKEKAPAEAETAVQPSEQPASAVAEPSEPVAPPAPPPSPVLELSPEEVVRLKKLAPKSIAKLKNTLATQFRVADVGGNVAALEARGDLSIEGNRINWKTEVADW